MHRHELTSTAISVLSVTLLLPCLAAAQTVTAGAGAPSGTAALEARLAALEAEVQSLRAQVQTQTIATAQPQTIEPRVAALEQRVAAPAPEGFRAANGTVRLSGFLKADTLLTRFNDGAAPATVAGGTAAREYYVPGATPVGGAAEGARLNAHAKQTRLILTVAPQVQGHTLSATVEMDFASAPGSQGTQNVSNAYNLGVRRAFLVYDGWQFGQDWTTFQNTAVLPETTDFIGPTDGTVFVRQPMVRYTHKVSDALTWQFALENPETVVQGVGTLPSGGQDDDSLPDAIARLNLTRGASTFSLAFIARQLSMEQPGFDERETGWGLSLSGRIPFGAQNVHDVRFMLTGGEGIGRYVGIGMIADAYAVGTGGARLEAIPLSAAMIATRFKLGPRTRTNMGLAWQEADLDPLLSAATASESSWSLFANVFFSPVPGTDFGFEYRRGERQLLNGQEGSLDRLHFVAKRGF